MNGAVVFNERVVNVLVVVFVVVIDDNLSGCFAIYILVMGAG